MGDYCGNCFFEKPTAGACPHCGYDPAKNAGKHPMALRTGTILNGRYIVGRVLGQGGFGITYAALDYPTQSRVAIKEYLPTDFAGRTQGTNAVQVHSEEMRENFDYGREQFLAEAKTLAEFIGNEHIVRIYSYFEENNTAYLAMEFIDGVSLDKYMAQHGGRLTVEQANGLLIPVMEAMDWVHSKGIVHRDIAPDNIIITKDGAAKLIDFGAARYSTGEKSKSLDVILKHGFAPKEQYMRHGRQGPFTDVYAMAGTYYYAITGKIPPDAIERIDEDGIFPPSTLGVKINGRTEDALLKAIEVSAPDRYQHMGEFVAALRAAAPQRPVQPVYQPMQPAQPVYQPMQPEQLVYQSVQPVQPVYQPMQPEQPVYQPVQPEEPPVQYVQPDGYEWQSEQQKNSGWSFRKKTTIFGGLAFVIIMVFQNFGILTAPFYSYVTTALGVAVLLACFLPHKPVKKTIPINCIASFDNIYSADNLWGNMGHSRKEVTKVTFLSTKEGAPIRAWDISEANDGSVVAWLGQDKTHLYAAADGIITAMSTKSLFDGFENVREIDFGGCFSTAETTDMSYMFYRCASLTALDVRGFDTSKVMNMSRMFYGCSSLTALDVSGFDTSRVTYMNDMFEGCHSLTALDVSDWNTSMVTYMSYMFYDCGSLTTLDVSGWDTSMVTYMSYMFYGCSSLTALDVSGFDTSKVTDMRYMFCDCRSLTALDVSGWDVSKVTDWEDFMDSGRTVNGRPWKELFGK